MQYETYQPYVIRLARRLVRFRRSGMIDENDLVSSAMIRLWERESKDGSLCEQIARQTIKYAMLDVLRNSALVKAPRSAPVQHALQAYQRMTVAAEPTVSPLEDWVEAEPVREVTEIINAFEYNDKLLLSLVWEQGCSMQEAADVLGLSKTRVFQRYNELLKSIKGKMLARRRARS